jgi:small neutral amino acid transporter SnatA (MarC family)
MEIPNPLPKLALDYWYQVLMVVCVAVFLLAGAGILKAFPVAPTAAISAAGFFVGLGEWINHPLQISIMRSTAYQPGGVLTAHPRDNKIIGVAFVALGVTLIAYGVYFIVA